MGCTKRSVITVAGTRTPLSGQKKTRGDTIRCSIQYREVSGLTGASLRFVAKSCVDDPDNAAEINLHSGTGGGIVIDTANSSDTLLIAELIIPPTATKGLEIVFPENVRNPVMGAIPKIRLNYDLQLRRADGTVTTIEGVEQEAHIWLLADVANTDTAP